MGNIQYIGCFFTGEAEAALRACSTDPLAYPIRDLHVTFVFQPKTVDPALIGLPLTVRVVGYGNDGRNEGVRVELSAKDKRLRELIRAIPLPHVTLSIAGDAKAVDTRYLNFAPLEGCTVRGTFGAFRDGKVVYEL